jgi:MFS transporter, NNP family, nitrate/nitrite transporter
MSLPSPSSSPAPGRSPAGFLHAGHTPTLLAAFLYFDLAFMVWVLLGALAVDIGAALSLSPSELSLAVAVPVLSGAFLRIVMGMLVDFLSPKKAAIIGQVVVIVALAWAWLAGIDSYRALILLGVCLGVAGAAFAAALPLASRWYPPVHQGTALGIAGAGNSGTVLAALLAPGLAAAYGWVNVFGLALIPLVVVLVVFVAIARDAPGVPAPASLTAYLAVLREADIWWLMFFYAVTFGGFVGLAASLVIYFNTEYGLSPEMAGYFTAGCVFAGSLVRPLGGYLADRIGGVRSLSLMYCVAAGAIAVVGLRLPEAWMAKGVLIVAMFAFGMGNGAVFQLVPQRFAHQLGVATGLIGMAGGLGGFMLAYSLGVAREATGSYQPGFLVFNALALAALACLTGVKQRWRSSWGRARISSVRI